MWQRYMLMFCGDLENDRFISKIHSTCSWSFKFVKPPRLLVFPEFLFYLPLKQRSEKSQASFFSMSGDGSTSPPCGLRAQNQSVSWRGFAVFIWKIGDTHTHTNRSRELRGRKAMFCSFWLVLLWKPIKFGFWADQPAFQDKNSQENHFYFL